MDLQRRRIYGPAGAVAASAGYALANDIYKHPGKYAKGAKRLLDYAGEKIRKRRRKSKRGKYGKRTYRSKKSLKHKVQELARIAKADVGNKIVRSSSFDRKTIPDNQKGILELPVNSKTIVENALSSLEYYDPGAPSSLVTADGNTGTYSKDFLFNYSGAKLMIKNNYTTTVVVKAYLCCVKSDTSILPQTAWSNGATDVGSASPTTLLSYPTDSPQFNELWSVKQTKKRTLKPGALMNFKVRSLPPFHYDPSISDSHTSEYQKAFKGCVIMLVMEGLPAHDVTENEIGVGGGRVDYRLDLTHKVQYAAGIDITRYSCSNDAATFSNYALSGIRPDVGINAFGVQNMNQNVAIVSPLDGSAVAVSEQP